MGIYNREQLIKVSDSLILKYALKAEELKKDKADAV